MSVTYTADVWCDTEGCSQWASGVTGAQPPRKGMARDVVRRDGFRHYLGKDYCPRCWRAMMETAGLARPE
jgi:hypothetical protein